ncbi:MAG: glycosyltransferase family 1 protein, partial [Actinomycetota bacterium]
EREGLLVRPGDVAALSDAMLKLASDEELRRAMGKAARIRAESSFPSWDEVTGMLAERLRATAATA